MTVEERLVQVDFSKHSKVKDSLLAQLKFRRQLMDAEIPDDELDEVVAAGGVALEDFPLLKKPV